MPMKHDILHKLDNLYHLSTSNNVEILFRWIMLCLKSNDKSIFPVAANFLSKHGRGLYVRPMYRVSIYFDLMKYETNPGSRPWTRWITIKPFVCTKKTVHSITLLFAICLTPCWANKWSCGLLRNSCTISINRDLNDQQNTFETFNPSKLAQCVQYDLLLISQKQTCVSFIYQSNITAAKIATTDPENETASDDLLTGVLKGTLVGVLTVGAAPTGAEKLWKIKFWRKSKSRGEFQLKISL